jgi:hypothetical protein
MATNKSPPRASSSSQSDSGSSESTPAFIIENVPVSVMQALYHEITGKTENLIKLFSGSRVVRKSDIEQLCIKFRQISEQFHIVGAGGKFTVHHNDGMVNSFSSLQKFLEYDENYPTAIESVVVEFSVLIKNPINNRHYEYKIELTCRSIDMLDKALQRAQFYEEFWEENSIYVKIEYVDYVVARTFMSAVEEWEKGLEKVKTSPVLAHLKRVSFPVRPFSPYDRVIGIVSRISAIFACFQLMDRMVDFSNLRSLTVFFLVCCSIYILTSWSSGAISDALTDQIRRYKNPNFVIMNRGDKINFDAYLKGNKSIITKSFIYILELTIIIIINVLSNKIYDLIK